MTKKPTENKPEPEQPSRVDKSHGGQIVEAVAPEDLESFNDAECKHEKVVRDPSEKDFVAFMCASPACNVVVLYNKQ